MDWNTLKILSAIQLYGSMSAAANKLGINYTTVFRRIETLEKEVGGKLFERGKTQYEPTPLAEEILTFANKMTLEAENIERNIVGKELQPKGVVKITAPFNIANRCLPSVIQQVREKYPEIYFQILSSNDDLNLNTRIADIAVRATTSPPEHLIGRKVTSLPWGIFVSEAFLQHLDTLPSFDTLGEFPLIGGAGKMMNLPAFAWLEKNHAKAIVIRCDELTAMSHLTQQGLGIAFLPIDQNRQGLIQLGEFVPGKSSDIWILTHPDLRKNTRVKIVADHLYEYFRSVEFV